MRRRISSLIAAVALFTASGLLLAQNADKNSAGPTKNDLKIRVTEPLEGATITGSTARVAVDYDRARYREQGTGETDKGLDKFPPPTFDVFLDNDLKQSLRGGNNVATIDNISPGSHKIVILAKNISGEVVDRKEVNITAIAAPMVASTTTSATTERVTREMPAPAPPPPAPSMSYQPPPAPAAPVETTLPTTGSASPRLALLGLVLVVGGLLLMPKKLR